jgi:hypothetical protein
MRMSAGNDPWRLAVGNEWTARDPFGAVKPADVTKASFDVGDDSGVRLRAARNGYASFRLWVAGAGSYRLAADMEGGLEADLFRAWYHKMAGDGKPRYCTDALVPAAWGAAAELPDADNAFDGQTHQEYWVDVFVPADAAVGRVGGRIVLEAGAQRVELPVAVDVVEAVVPDEDAVLCDHNSYGCRWASEYYPGVFTGCDDEAARAARTVEILHHYYRICHEHRGMLSNLGAGHHGGFDRIYGPRTTGAGRTKSLTGWERFDSHYGPLLDGSAFAQPGPGAPRPRRPAKPVWGVYTPINAAWPADYLYWGQPGYEVEFTRCVGEFDRHFREKGWLTTHPYFFFNHKKRYRWFEWDGDEPKYAKDDAYYVEMGRLFQAAVGDTPVPWLFRMDASWQMKNEWEKLAGIVNYWVCGGFARWYGKEVRPVVERGDVVWTYSGTPAIDAPSSALLEHVWRIWARGLHGHCDWLSVRPDPDVWFACEGAAVSTIYPGERFGIAGPIPSARLKMQRNAVQDVNLIDAAKASGRLAETRQRLTDVAGLAIWEDPPPIVLQAPPEEWDSANLTAGSQDDNMSDYAGQDPLWWVPLRRAALGEEVLP